MVRGLHHPFLPSRESGSRPPKKEALNDASKPIILDAPRSSLAEIFYFRFVGGWSVKWSYRVFLQLFPERGFPTSDLFRDDNDSYARQADKTHRPNSASVHLPLYIEVVRRALG